MDKLLIFMAPEVGLEPTTLRLTAECSAIELLRSVLERGKIRALRFHSYNKYGKVGQRRQLARVVIVREGSNSGIEQNGYVIGSKRGIVRRSARTDDGLMVFSGTEAAFELAWDLI